MRGNGLRGYNLLSCDSKLREVSGRRKGEWSTSGHGEQLLRLSSVVPALRGKEHSPLESAVDKAESSRKGKVYIRGERERDIHRAGLW